MEERFSNEVIDIVSAALNKARTAPLDHPDMPFRAKIKVEQAKIQYKIKDHQPPLNDHSWTVDFIEEVRTSREFYEAYIDCCRRFKKKPAEPHYVKTLLTIQFLQGIMQKAWPDTSFQVHVSGVHVASKRNFATSTIIGRFIIGRRPRRLSFLMDGRVELSEAMEEVLAEYGGALSLMQSGETTNLVIPYAGFLDYAVNYM